MAEVRGFEVVAQATQLRERLASVEHEDLAFGCLDQAARCALEELRAYDRLDLGQGFRDGGLRQRQMLGDAADMQPFADRNQQLEVLELEVRAQQTAELSQSSTPAAVSTPILGQT
jgi:hypothetical protein